jgi:hypothetical protein
MTAPRKPEPVEPELTPDMLSSVAEFYAGLINPVRRRFRAFEPAPGRPRMGPVLRKALGLPPEDQHD